METLEKILPVNLTDDELKVRTNELTTALKKKDQIDLEKKGAMAEYKNKLEDIAITISQLTTIVHDKKERRPIQCHLRFDYERSLVETVRNDLGEVVESRSMTISEKQQKLDFETAKA